MAFRTIHAYSYKHDDDWMEEDKYSLKHEEYLQEILNPDLTIGELRALDEEIMNSNLPTEERINLRLEIQTQLYGKSEKHVSLYKKKKP